MNRIPLWIAAPLVAICMTAQAETTVQVMPQAGSGLLRQYHNADTSLCQADPCEPENQVTFYVGTSNSFFFGSGTPRLTVIYQGLPNLPSGVYYKCVFDQAAPQGTPCQQNGEFVTVTLVEHTTTVHVPCSGRGCKSTRTYWFLDGGSIVFP